MTIDRSKWPPGPWDEEPDRIEFRSQGLPCLMKRNDMGVWCGYVAVPPGHPAHGKHYNDVDVYVHGGLTYGNACTGSICHKPGAGEPDDVWWLGFDCNHGGDIAPGFLAMGFPAFPFLGKEPTYKTADWVRAEVEHLAQQLAKAWLA